MIRFTFTNIRPVALILVIIVLIQSCVAYDKQPIKIDEAINKNHKKQKRIKIEMIDGTKLILNLL